MKLFILILAILYIAQCPARGYYRRPIYPPPSGSVYPRENSHHDMAQIIKRYQRDLPTSLWPSEWVGWFLDRVDKSKKPNYNQDPQNMPPYRPMYPESWAVFPIQLNRERPDLSDWGIFPNTSDTFHPPCWPLDTRPQCLGYGR